VFVGVTLRQVRDVEAALRLQVGRLVPGDIPLSDAPATWQAYDAIERLAAAAKTLLAARVDESGAAQRAGDQGTAEYLARKSGSSLGTARTSLETSKKVAELPHTGAAMRRGELSRSQADEIASAAAANPGAERSLLLKAANSSLAELREVCARTRAQADPDPEATHRRIHRDRRLRRWTDSQGAWNLAACGTPDAGSPFNTVLDPIIDELFHAARRAGLREPREAYAFDALIELARRRHSPRAMASRAAASESSTDPPTAEGDGAPVAPRERTPAQAVHDPTARRARSVDPTHLALLRIDLKALVRGHTDGDELCEIAGVGPVPVDAARRLLGESVLKLVITNGVAVANVAHLGRGPSAAQRIALLWSSPACAVLGCPRLNHQGIEHDHRTPWTAVHETTLANIDRLCAHHHDLKTRRGWALVPGTGRRPMVPPHDPRHPDHQATGPPGSGDPPSLGPRPEEPSLFGDAA
jgi:Domain of unknown function (DUF222)